MEATSLTLRRSSNDSFSSSSDGITSRPSNSCTLFVPLYHQALEGRYLPLFKEIHRAIKDYQDVEYNRQIVKNAVGFDRLFVCEVLKAFFPMIKAAMVVNQEIVIHLFKQNEVRKRKESSMVNLPRSTYSISSGMEMRRE